MKPRLLELLAVAYGVKRPEATKTPQGRAYFDHLLLAGIVCIVLVAQIYFWVTDANVSTTGGFACMFFIFLGLPSLVIFVATVYHSLSAITDGRVIVLTVALLVLAFSPVIGSLVISITMTLLYVGLAAFLALPPLFRSRKEQSGIHEEGNST